MKKVLLIGFFNPFTLYQGGGYRLLPLVKYLPEFDWQPVVLAAPLIQRPNVKCQILETPYRDTLAFWKKLLKLDPRKDIKWQVKGRLGIASKRSLLDPVLTFLGEFLYYPDAHKGWRPFAFEKGNERLSQGDIEAMISYQPLTSYLVAADLKAIHKIPWVADLEDLWSQNHNYSYSQVRRLMDKRLEQKTLAGADALVTISEPWAEKLRNLHKRKPVYVITHGFDPEGVIEPPIELTKKFTITYTGSIYARKQDPTKLFIALQELISDGTIRREDIEVRFYGVTGLWLGNEIRRYGLSDIIKQYERVPEEIARQKQRESQLLLLLDWDDPQEKGVYTTKVFGYLGVRRPILATGGSDGDVVDELLSETKAGIHAPTVEDIKSTLKELYQEYRLNGVVAYKGKQSKISKYSHMEMAKKFSEVLDRVTSK